MDRRKLIENPYRPGAGHPPPYLAGRMNEQDFFRRLLRQGFTTQNILVTGLRGFGKTVLLDQLRRLAEADGWLWVGNDLSESSSLSEERLALRILTDLARAFSDRMSQVAVKSTDKLSELNANAGAMTFDALKAHYERSPGLPSDKLKAVFQRAGAVINRAQLAGLVIAYDEAQCLSDHAERNEFPMSMLIETVASLQRQDGSTPCLLVLSGLPQVFEQLTETRTYTERMFHVMTLDRLSRQDSNLAIRSPLSKLSPPLHATEGVIEKAVDLSGGYPFLIQFFGKELVDGLMNNGGVLHEDQFPDPACMERLDAGLFAARWNKTTDRQREFLRLIASRGESLDFSAQEISARSASDAQMTNAQCSQALQALVDRGILYRTRHGRYAFTVPMSEAMILRRMQADDLIEQSWVSAPRSPVDGDLSASVDQARSAVATSGKAKRFRKWFKS